MVKNYLISHLRNLLKNKVYLIINILGLTVSLTCGILAIAFIFDEYAFDRFHANGDNLYRLNKRNVNRRFAVLITIAMLVGSPLAYYLMNRWTNNFAYPIDIGIWVFLVAGAGAMVIVLVVVSFQSIKAGLANPIKSLRHD